MLASQGSVALVVSVTQRIERATVDMLASANDGRFLDLQTVSFTLLASLAGAICTLFEQDTDASVGSAVHRQLQMMFRHYLIAARIEILPGGRD